MLIFDERVAQLKLHSIDFVFELAPFADEDRFVDRVLFSRNASHAGSGAYDTKRDDGEASGSV